MIFEKRSRDLIDVADRFRSSLPCIPLRQKLCEVFLHCPELRQNRIAVITLVFGLDEEIERFGDRLPRERLAPLLCPLFDQLRIVRIRPLFSLALRLFPVGRAQRLTVTRLLDVDVLGAAAAFGEKPVQFGVTGFTRQDSGVVGTFLGVSLAMTSTAGRDSK